MLAAHGIEAQHPDEFVEHLFDLDLTATCAAIRDQRAALKNPPLSVDELLDAFLRQGLAVTVSHLRPHATIL